MSTSDDEANLEDLREAEEALIKAHQALTRAMCGLSDQDYRSTFVFQVGFARGKLSRVTGRIYEAGEKA